MDAVLLRDASVADPDRVVDVYTSSGNNPFGNSSYPDYFDLRDSGDFESLAASALIPMVLDAKGQTASLAGELVSGNYFDVLGVRLPFGRAFTADEDQIGAPARVAVISHALWQRSFDGNPSMVGQTIRLNGHAYTLVGVAPREFVGPMLGLATDVWVPMALQPEVDPPSPAVRQSRGHSRKFDLRGSRGLNMVGRLPKDGSIVQAASGADVIANRLQAAYPDSNRNRKFTIAPLGEGRGLRVATRPILRQLAGVVAIVLLVACVNVASLLLARAASRGREVAVRVAVGASRGRLVRQWLAESVLLALFGSFGALLIAWWGTPLLHAFVIPEVVDLSVNPRVLGVHIRIAIGSGLLFGLAPILQSLRRDTITALREEGGAVATGARAARLRGAFVILQVALSLVLLVGAGLFLRTLNNAYSVDLPYQVDQTLVASLNLEVRGYSQDAGLAAYGQILSRVEALPGVIAAGVARMTVLSGGAPADCCQQRRSSHSAGQQQRRRRLAANTVSDRYLETMNIPILRGRSFGSSDRVGTPRVTIVSQALVATPLAQRGSYRENVVDEGNRVQMIVGVVPDTVYTSTRARCAADVLPAAIAELRIGVALHVRAGGDPTSLIPAIREAVRQVDSQLVVERPQLLRDVLDRSLGRQRMMATLIGIFAAVVLILAIVGLYGVMAHAATQRTTEIGIRLAMGAQPASIVTLVIWRGVRLLAIGVAIGLTGALIGTR